MFFKSSHLASRRFVSRNVIKINLFSQLLYYDNLNYSCFGFHKIDQVAYSEIYFSQKIGQIKDLDDNSPQVFIPLFFPSTGTNHCRKDSIEGCGTYKGENVEKSRVNKGKTKKNCNGILDLYIKIPIRFKKINCSFFQLGSPKWVLYPLLVAVCFF